MTECIYILLPVHNRKDVTLGFIHSLQRQVWQNYHLILIDDGSTDGTAQMVQEHIAEEKLTVLKGNGNWWWAGSLQQGVNWLKQHNLNSSDVVLMINDDLSFDDNFLHNGIKFIRDHRDSLLLSRFYDVELGEIVETGVMANWDKLSFRVADLAKDINCLSTRGLFMRFYVLMKIGGFHPVLLPHYGSDYEFTMRAIHKGFSVATVPDVYLFPDLTTSGIRAHNAISLIDEITTMFSKRCLYNPLYWSSFIFLSCPLRYVPLNLLRIWFGAIRRILINNRGTQTQC